MKKLVIILMIPLLFLANTIIYADDNNNYIDDDNIAYFDTVMTPNGSLVDVAVVEEDYSQSLINSYDAICDSKYPNAHRIASATKLYNCHSYAWYSQDYENNIYCMTDPSSYYEDNSYCEVFVPRPGDIICYFNDLGTPNDTSDDYNSHSGVVMSYDSTIESNNVCGNANQVTVISKWGEYGLYEHQGDYCPYVLEYMLKTSYVKYYRPRTDSSYNLSEYMSSITINTELSCSGTVLDKYKMY